MVSRSSAPLNTPKIAQRSHHPVSQKPTENAPSQREEQLQTANLHTWSRIFHQWQYRHTPNRNKPGPQNQAIAIVAGVHVYSSNRRWSGAGGDVYLSQGDDNRQPAATESILSRNNIKMTRSCTFIVLCVCPANHLG